MNGVIIIMLVVSLIVTVASFIFIVMDLKTMTQKNYKGTYIVPNALLLVLGLAWFAISILLYLNFQSQLSILSM